MFLLPLYQFNLFLATLPHFAKWADSHSINSLAQVPNKILHVELNSFLPDLSAAVIKSNFVDFVFPDNIDPDLLYYVLQALLGTGVRCSSCHNFVFGRFLPKYHQVI